MTGRENLATPAAAPSFATVSHYADWADLFESSRNVVVQPRPAVRLTRAAVRVAEGQTRTWLRVLEAREPANASELAVCIGNDELAQDLAQLVGVFADLTGAERIGVRLTVTDAATCPRFHVDQVAVRLVVTYLGPGTEWLSDDDVDRAKLTQRAWQVGERDPALRPEARILRAPQSAVVLLKGEALAGEGRGAVHRSPPLSRGERRVVATLDALA